jgi:hypothetical protein
MKKAHGRRQRKETGLASEYRFDYSKAKPNRFARSLTARSVIVDLDPDVARYFKTSRSINAALRSVLAKKKRVRRAS